MRATLRAPVFGYDPLVGELSGWQTKACATYAEEGAQRPHVVHASACFSVAWGIVVPGNGP